MDSSKAVKHLLFHIDSDRQIQIYNSISHPYIYCKFFYSKSYKKDFSVKWRELNRISEKTFSVDAVILVMYNVSIFLKF